MAAGSPNVTASVTQVTDMADLVGRRYTPRLDAATGLPVTTIVVEYRISVASRSVAEQITQLVGKNMAALESMFTRILQNVEGLKVVRVAADPPRISMEMLVKPPPEEGPGPNWLAISLGAVTGLVLVVAVWFWRRKKRKKIQAATAEYVKAAKSAAVSPIVPYN